MERLLFVVEDTFLIEGRGLILVPGVGGNVQLRDGRALIIKRPDGGVLHVAKFSFGMPGPKSEGCPILLPSEVTKGDVPIGSEVWMVSDS